MGGMMSVTFLRSLLEALSKKRSIPCELFFGPHQGHRLMLPPLRDLREQGASLASTPESVLFMPTSFIPNLWLSNLPLRLTHLGGHSRAPRGTVSSQGRPGLLWRIYPAPTSKPASARRAGSSSLGAHAWFGTICPSSCAILSQVLTRFCLMTHLFVPGWTPELARFL